MISAAYGGTLFGVAVREIIEKLGSKFSDNYLFNFLQILRPLGPTTVFWVDFVEKSDKSIQIVQIFLFEHEYHGFH